MVHFLEMPICLRWIFLTSRRLFMTSFFSWKAWLLLSQLGGFSKVKLSFMFIYDITATWRKFSMNKNGTTGFVGSVANDCVCSLKCFWVVDVFFFATWLDIICFSILTRSTGESKGLKKRYMTNTTTWIEVDVMNEKTWKNMNDESSVCNACFFLACCTDTGILPLYTLNN